MDKIKELWAKLLDWIQLNPLFAAIGGVVILVGGFLLWKRMKRQRMYRRAARRARLAKKKKRTRR